MREGVAIFIVLIICLWAIPDGTENRDAPHVSHSPNDPQKPRRILELNLTSKRFTVQLTIFSSVLLVDIAHQVHQGGQLDIHLA